MNQPDPGAIDLAHRILDLARGGEVEALRGYLAHGLPANLSDPQGNTLLMLAAYHGHADLVRLLLEHGADPDRLNDRGQSPIAGALFKGEEEVVAVLLAAGADLDAGSPSARATADVFGRTDLLPEP